MGQGVVVIGTRVLTPDDWRLWRELRLAALAEAPDAFGSRLADWQGAGDRADRWRSRLEIPGYHIVALLDGRAVGMASGVPAEGRPDAVELISMWVAPEARGRGVGDHLVRAVERWAATTGAAWLVLAVAEGNVQAEALYRRRGFVDTGEPDPLMPDGLRREHLMARPVRSAAG